LTLSCPWLSWWTWEVLDAEEHHVGVLRGGTLLDRLGRPLAQVRRRPQGGGHSFVNPEGDELAILIPLVGSDRLTFSPELAGDPFGKMVVLAGALVLTNRRSP
jgi:hypothetical protein